MTQGPPRLEDHFELEDELGRGGFGVVLRARHRATGERAAVKLGQLEPSTEEMDRIRREVSLLRKLEHPHLVRFLGLFRVEDGRLALVYELVEGRPLSLAHEDGAPAPEAVVRWIQEVAAGLDYLHRAGLVHRDVKPENIMLDAAGHARLLDFGLARTEATGATVTATGLILGTPAFMPPEAFRGERSQAAGDRFALAATAYWLLTGRTPFGKEPAEVMRNLARPPPSVGASEGGEAVDGVLRRGLATASVARFQSCGLFAQELAAAVSEAPRRPSKSAERTRVLAPSPLERGARTPPRAGGPGPTPGRAGGTSRISKRLRRPAAALGCSLVISVAVAYALVGSPRPRPAPPPPPSPPPVPAGDRGPEPPDATDPRFLPEALRRVRQRMSEMSEVFLDKRGERIPSSKREEYPGARWILDPDPVYWPELLAALPELEAQLEALAAGARLEEQSPEFQDEAARTDRYFRAQHLPEPFAPFRGLRPAPAPVAARLRLEAGLDVELPAALDRPLTGWAGTAADTLANLMLELQLLGKQYIHEGSTPPEVLRPALQVAEHFALSKLPEVFEKTFFDPELRAGLTRAFRSQLTALHRVYLAAGRSLREEPEQADAMALLFGATTSEYLRAVGRCHLLRLPTRLLTGPLPPDSPAAAHLEYWLPASHGTGQNTLGAWAYDLEAIPADLLRLAQVAAGPGDSPAARRRRLEARRESLRVLIAVGRGEEALRLYQEAAAEAADRGEAPDPHLVLYATMALEDGAGPGVLSEPEARALLRTIRSTPYIRERFRRLHQSLQGRKDWARTRYLVSRDLAELEDRLERALEAIRAAAEGG